VPVNFVLSDGTWQGDKNATRLSRASRITSANEYLFSAMTRSRDVVKRVLWEAAWVRLSRTWKIGRIDSKKFRSKANGEI
jgi:hypothetical protein